MEYALEVHEGAQAGLVLDVGSNKTRLVDEATTKAPEGSLCAGGSALSLGHHARASTGSGKVSVW